jgi:hypothetical protein
MCATFPAHLILYFITLIIFCGAYTLGSCSLCRLLHHPATSQNRVFSGGDGIA